MTEEDPKKVATVIREDKETGEKVETQQTLEYPGKFYQLPLEKGVTIQRTW